MLISRLHKRPILHCSKGSSQKNEEEYGGYAAQVHKHPQAWCQYVENVSGPERE
jgi:hypothetical protein